MRALQEQVVEPVGGHASVRVDVRILAATNKDLSEEIKAGRFREDLFFRLNVIPLWVPPLRERGNDVIRLAEHFISEFASEYGRRQKRLALEAQQAMRGYRWPGNVRELRNVIERLMIMVPSETIEVADLWFLDPLYEARDTWERDYLLKALAAFDGNMSRTADALGVERSNLYRKMRGLGIQTRREEEEQS